MDGIKTLSDEQAHPQISQIDHSVMMLASILLFSHTEGSSFTITEEDIKAFNEAYPGGSVVRREVGEGYISFTLMSYEQASAEITLGEQQPQAITQEEGQAPTAEGTTQPQD